MELPLANNLPIQTLSKCFDNKTNAYKYYWFWSILDHISDEESLVVPFKDLALRMISRVWYPLDYYKLSFGKQDSFKSIATNITSKIRISNATNALPLFDQINEGLNKSEIDEIQKQVFSLLRWVPYRFIRPFFGIELVGVEDSIVNRKIVELANKSKDKNICPYWFEDDGVVLSEIWREYFRDHQKILRDFIQWNLVRFLQKHNPNVIGLSEKLDKRKERGLKNARQFWNEYLQNNFARCIYSGIELNPNNFSLDHFIPWSYVAHDELWNIVPTFKSINSSKGNWLPSFDKYFNPFANLQFDAINYHIENEKFQFIEEYSLLFGSSKDQIKKYSLDEFRTNIERKVLPIFETAKNMGFNYPYEFKR